MHLAENLVTYQKKGAKWRTQTINWLFLGSRFSTIPRWWFWPLLLLRDEKQEYPINRFAMEAKRQLDVLDKQLANKFLLWRAKS